MTFEKLIMMGSLELKQSYIQMKLLCESKICLIVASLIFFT